jgi:hypothetical protein
MQELHTFLEKCSKYVISVQAECAMTTDVKFLLELENFMGDILPLESQAHTWHSELFYRFVLDCVSNKAVINNLPLYLDYWLLNISTQLATRVS